MSFVSTEIRCYENSDEELAECSETPPDLSVRIA